MENVKVNKFELIAKIEANRATHQAIFDEACDGYKNQVEAALLKHLESVRTGKMQQIRVFLDAPVNHIKDYDRAIAMLNMSVDDEVEIDEESFGCYVLDEWTWKRQFLTSNSTYSVGATQQLAGWNE